MKKGLSKQDRLIKIELLRVRASLQRQELERSVVKVRSSAYTGWLSKAFVLYKRYPYILGSVSGMLSSGTKGKRSMVWRIGLAAIATWQLARGFKSRRIK